MLYHKTLISIIGLFIATGFLGELLYYFQLTDVINITSIFSGLGRVLGIIVILRSGTLISKRPFFLFIFVFIILTLIGILFKITHAPYANLLLQIGLVSIPVVYFMHVLRKPVSHALDYIKLLWIVAFCTAAIVMLLHWQYGRELKTAEGLLFLALFSVYAYNSVLLKKDLGSADGINKQSVS